MVEAHRKRPYDRRPRREKISGTPSKTNAKNETERPWPLSGTVTSATLIAWQRDKLYKSSAWQRIGKFVRERAENRCEWCGSSGPPWTLFTLRASR